jgi:hypothetical protein
MAVPQFNALRKNVVENPTMMPINVERATYLRMLTKRTGCSVRNIFLIGLMAESVPYARSAART